MVVEPTAAAVYTDFQGLTRLRAEAGRQSPEALREAAQQFEAIFVQMMLKSMRDTVARDETLFDSRSLRFYEGMFDQQMSLSLATGGRGIGIADVIYRQLGGRTTTPEAGGGKTAGKDGETPLPLPTARLPSALQRRVLAAIAQAEADDAASPGGATTVAATPAESSWQNGTAAAFVRETWPHAERAAARLGIAPEVLVAQAALETGWGRHVIRHADGRSSYNLFGIKADERWTGERVVVSTIEYVDGVAERQSAAFRAYRGIRQSFDDYAEFIAGNPRYRDALRHAADPQRYLRGIQRAGYATDPAYADKILSLLQRGPLSGHLAVLKSGGSQSIT